MGAGLRRQETTGCEEVCRPGGQQEQFEQLAAARGRHVHAGRSASVGPHAILLRRFAAEGTELDARIPHRAAATTVLLRPHRLQRHVRAGPQSAVPCSAPQCKARGSTADASAQDAALFQQWRSRLPACVRAVPAPQTK